MTLRQSQGKLVMLRVHDVGTGYGAPPNLLDTEVVLRLHSEEGKAFGFKLRDDGNRPVREGMLGLLRDALAHDWTVTIDYDIADGTAVGEVRRVVLTR